MFVFTADENTGELFASACRILADNAETIRNLAGIPADAEISVWICDRKTVQALNRSFRNLDQPTDVLSWPNHPEEHDIILPEEVEKAPYGEIAICAEICAEQAEMNGWALETEWLRLIIHAIAHIVGFDHQTAEQEKQMLSLEKKILSAIGLDNIYPN